MELRHLRYFLAIADELHFGRAARTLHLSQSALSQSLAQLERELGGVQLFTRDKRSVTMTPAGHAFRGPARRAIDASDRAMWAAQRAAAGGARELRLGFLDAAAFWPLPQAVDALAQARPPIGLTLHHSHGDDLLELLRRRELDAAFCHITGSDPSIEFLSLCSERLVLLVAEGHPLAERTSIDLEDLEGHPLVVPQRHSAADLHDGILRLCADAGFEPTIAARAASAPMMLHLVAAGIGVCMLTETVAGWQRDMPIASIPVDAPPISTGLGLATRRGDGTPTVERLVSVCMALPSTTRRRTAR
jgi:DNA-binding transcriptional LysR family regulator